MNALDSSLETLTLRQINLNPLLAAAFSNLWALLAVVAAAATYHFRRLRSPKPPPSSSSSPPSSETSKPVVPELERSTSNNKEVFTVYYHDNDESNDVNDVLYDADFNDEDEVEDEDEDEEIEMVEEKPMRGGEFGWYDFQDRRVIDGSVVKLWGPDFERSTSPRSCCSFRRVNSINSNNGNNFNINSLRRCCSLGVTPFSFGLI